MSGAELLWAACPGQVIALVAASALLGAAIAMLMALLFAPEETDTFEEDELWRG